MRAILLSGAALFLLTASAGAQTQGAAMPGNTPAGTNMSTGGVSIALPRVEIIPVAGVVAEGAGAIGAQIENPPPSPLQNRVGSSTASLRPDLEGGAQSTGSRDSAGDVVPGSAGGAPRRAMEGPPTGSTSIGQTGTAGAIDQQRSSVQQELRNTGGAGITASEGIRPNRVAGDRIDARQNRLGSDATGSVSGNSSLGGRTGSTSTGLGGSLGGAARSGGASSGGSSAGGGSAGGGSGGGGR